MPLELKQGDLTRLQTQFLLYALPKAIRTITGAGPGNQDVDKEAMRDRLRLAAQERRRKED